MSATSTYAQALFEAARDLEEIEETLDNLKEFVNALHESEELREFFYGVHISEGQKRRAIDALTEDMTTSMRNFLKVLVDNGREELLEEIVPRYEDLVEEYQGKVEVEVTTAVELSDEMLERVRSRLGEILEGREVILETHVDPNLLGGAVVRVGERQIDRSVRTQLQGLRGEMLQRGAV
ncbi:MAG TPA: ATP synthase F1 subunit delta [Rubrobacteraceae bacterium]|nr:ATP synthase F1 subunit delta [Rubrobacteraceae bacterium]